MKVRGRKVKRLLGVAFMLVSAVALGFHSGDVCAFGFCDDCQVETDAVYWSWVEAGAGAPGSECKALQKSAEYCTQQCPTCSFCATRTRTARITCGLSFNDGCGLTLDGGYSNSCDCNPDDPACTSPVLIDVARDGYRLTNVTSGVSFDLRATGTAIQTAWTEADSDDAWLVLDRNSNGKIDDSTELFGNFTPQPPSANKNGFLALAEYDKVSNGGNTDDQITDADAVFGTLRLWQDRNHNGTSESSELMTLPAAGVESISLNYKESRRMDQYANVFRYRAKVNGSLFAYDVFLTTVR